MCTCRSKELHFTIDDNMYSLVDGDPMESSQFVCLHPSAKSETFYPCKPFSREFNIVRRVQGEAPQLLKQKQVIQQVCYLFLLYHASQLYVIIDMSYCIMTI